MPEGTGLRPQLIGRNSALGVSTISLAGIPWLPGDFAFLWITKDGSNAPDPPDASWTNLGSVSVVATASATPAYRFLQAGDTDAIVGTWFDTPANFVVEVYRYVEAIGNVGGGSLDGELRLNTVVMNDPGMAIFIFGGYTKNTDIRSYGISGFVNNSIGQTVTSNFNGYTTEYISDWPQRTIHLLPGRSFGYSLELVGAQPDPETDPVYSVVAGALPTGLSLNSATGEITGTPTVVGDFEFTFRVSNNYRVTEDQECSMTVYPGSYSIGGSAGSIPASTWVFDLGRFVTMQEQVWHKREGIITRPTLVNGKDVLYVDSSRVVQSFDKDLVSTGAYWTSPTLNRQDREAEVTLARVILRYESAAELVIAITASGDGGETWQDGFMVPLTLKPTGGKILRIVQGFNVSGPDLRFRIELPDDGLSRIHEWRAELVRRDNKHKD